MNIGGTIIYIMILDQTLSIILNDNYYTYSAKFNLNIYLVLDKGDLLFFK